MIIGPKRELRGIAEAIHLGVPAGETIYAMSELAARVCLDHYAPVAFEFNGERYMVRPQDLVACVKKVGAGA